MNDHIVECFPFGTGRQVLNVLIRIKFILRYYEEHKGVGLCDRTRTHWRQVLQLLVPIYGRVFA